MKDIVILGGPNGAGKTTAARVLLPSFLDLREYLNADEIAREISPDDVDAAAFAAGRELIHRMRRLVAREESFGLETTLSGKSYVPLLRDCRSRGWRISLFYFWLPSPQASMARVARRVASGGHNIPSEAILRRFRTGLSNMLRFYLPLAHEAEIYDNSNNERVLIAEKRHDELFVCDRARWAQLKEAIQ